MSELTDITVTEIRQACDKLNWRVSAVDTLVREIRAMRDPVWREGDIVVSHSGSVFIKLPEYGWKEVSSNNIVSDAYPSRPIKKIGTTG